MRIDALTKALEAVRHARQYARTADTDEEQAQQSVVDAQGDLLEAIAQYLIDQPPRTL